MQEVLNQWNAVIDGPVIFRLSNDTDSPVNIIFDPNMLGCYDDILHWGYDYTFSEAMIKINPDESYCETYNTNTKYSLYFHAFAAVIGFDYNSPTFDPWSNFNQIPNKTEVMIHALYKVPPGYYLGASKQKTNKSSTVIKNMQLSIDSGCVGECRK